MAGEQQQQAEGQQQLSEKEFREQLNTQLQQAFTAVGQRQQQTEAQMAALQKAIERASSVGQQQQTGLSREELSRRVLDEFVSDPAAFFENLGKVNRQLIQQGIQEERSKERQQQEI